MASKTIDGRVAILAVGTANLNAAAAPGLQNWDQISNSEGEVDVIAPLTDESNVELTELKEVVVGVAPLDVDISTAAALIANNTHIQIVDLTLPGDSRRVTVPVINLGSNQQIGAFARRVVEV